MIELLRRLLLLAGLSAAAWCVWYTPAELVAVRVVDFAAEYEARYGARRYPVMGAMELGRELIRKHSNPGSAEALRRNAVGARPLAPVTGVPADWPAQLEAAQRGTGPLAARVQSRSVYFDLSESPVAPFAAPLRASLRSTGFANAYTQASGRDIEFTIYREPHSSPAPASVMFPLRGRARWPAFASLCVYLLLSLAAPCGARYDAVALAVLDLASAVAAALFFGLPLLVCDSTQAALDDPLGGPVWSWAVSGLAAGALIALARCAAFAIEAGEDSLRLRGLFSVREIPLSQIARVSLLGAAEEGERGICLHLSGGDTCPLHWAGLVDTLPIYDLLVSRGLLEAARTVSGH